MKPFSSRFFRDPVTHYAVVEDDSTSTGVPALSWPGDGTPLTCRAEVATGVSTNARRVTFVDSVESSTQWTLGFTADPGCKLQDKFVLTDGGRVLIALGPARRDASGDSVLFLVDCEERK